MSEIQMLRTAAGPFGTFLAGQTYEVLDVLAAAFVQSGSALYTRPPQQEIDGDAVDPEPENAMRKIEADRAVRPRRVGRKRREG